MGNLQNELREKFKRSDALNTLKEISQSMTKEEFVDFSYVAMKSAYDRNREKAVEYMLSFCEYNKPRLLMAIHLQVMLADAKDFESGKKMLKVLTKNFSTELCCKIMSDFIEYHKGKPEYKEREKQILNMILEEKIPENNDVKPKKLKI